MENRPTDEETAPGPRSLFAHQAHVELLEAVISQLEVRHPRQSIRDAVREAEECTSAQATAADGWQRLLSESGSRLGIRVARWTAGADERALPSALGMPAATFDASLGWVVLTERQGRRVRAITGFGRGERLHRWWDEKELKGALSPGGEGAVWMILASATTLSDVTQSGHAVSPWRRILDFAKTEKSDLTLVVMFSATAGLLSLATPLAVQSLVNTVAFGTLVQPLFVLMLLLLVSLAFFVLLNALQTYVVELMQRRFFVRLVSDFAYRLPRLRIEALDQRDGSELANRFFDVVTVQKSIASLLLDGLAVVLQTLVGLLVLAFYHPYLLVFDVLIVTGIGFIVFGLGRGAIRTAISESHAKFRVGYWLENVAGHARVAKLGSGPERVFEEGDDLAKHYVEARSSHFRVVYRQTLAALILYALVSTLLLGLGGFLVLEGQLTVGQLIAAELIVGLIVSGFAKLGKQLDGFYDLLAAFDKIGGVFSHPLESLVGGDADATDGCDVRVTKASYSYAGADRPALRDVDLALSAGTKFAVLGDSGSGKSTLADLLVGVRTPQSGAVAFGGQQTSFTRLSALRRSFCLVRGVEIVDGTVRENLSAGGRTASFAEMHEALARVGLDGPLARFSSGLDLRLLPSGAPLSSGEAEKLGLARALLANPSVLVIDGTFDSFDAPTREALIETMTRDERVTLVVFTRLLEVADRFSHRAKLVEGALVSLEEGQ